MNKTKRFFALLLCGFLCTFFLCHPIQAVSSTPTITISNQSAMPGDSVTIKIDIANNPGIQAIAFCVTYDKDNLVFDAKTFEETKATSGYITNPTYTDHSDKGHISFSDVGNTDKTTNGTMLSLPFKIKSNAKAGKYTIAIANNNREKYGYKLHNSFSNSKQQAVVPTVISGSITVGETCENSGHKYGDYTITKPADCKNTGLKTHTCIRCDFSEEIEIPITHDFEEEWTIDKAATPQEDGIMSRHCIKCEAVTDKITFKYEEIIDDNSGTSNQTDSSNSSSNTDITQPDSNQPLPDINNVVGEKIPLSKVEEFEDYKQNIQPNLENSASQDNSSSNQETSSLSSGDNPDSTDSVQNHHTDAVGWVDEPSFFATPGGILTIIICSLFSIGIITLGIIIIIRNKKQ